MMWRRLFLSLLLLVGGPVLAHKASDSYLVLQAKGTQVSGQWDIALRDIDFAIGLDADGNGDEDVLLAELLLYIVTGEEGDADQQHAGRGLIAEANRDRVRAAREGLSPDVADKPVGKGDRC